MPCFTTEATIDLKDAFIKLGVQEVFTDASYLSIMFKYPTKVDKMTHKTYIKVTLSFIKMN